VSRNREFVQSVLNTDWMHGTDERSADNIWDSGQRADFRGIQKFGPGFYVTPHQDHAEAYADSAASYRGAKGVIQHGVPLTDNPIEVSYHDLENIGRQFKEQHPNPGAQDLPDAHAGNIALRQRGHDFMRVTHGPGWEPIDVGVALRPKVWSPSEEFYVGGKPRS
jgi:hypothetical protein